MFYQNSGELMQFYLLIWGANKVLHNKFTIEMKTWIKN